MGRRRKKNTSRAVRLLKQLIKDLKDFNLFAVSLDLGTLEQEFTEAEIKAAMKRLSKEERQIARWLIYEEGIPLSVLVDIAKGR